MAKRFSLNKRFIAHYNADGRGRYGGFVQRDGEGFRAFGPRFDISVEEGIVDVLIVPPEEDREEFKSHVESIVSGEFWKRDDISHLIKHQRSKYSAVLEDFRVEVNGDGNYHAKAKLTTKNKDAIFFAVSNVCVKPFFWDYYREFEKRRK